MSGIVSFVCRILPLGWLLCVKSLVGDRRTGLCRFWMVVGILDHSLLLFLSAGAVGVVLIRAVNNLCYYDPDYLESIQ